jgi:hypothetical protein
MLERQYFSRYGVNIVSPIHKIRVGGVLVVLQKPALHQVLGLLWFGVSEYMQDPNAKVLKIYRAEGPLWDGAQPMINTPSTLK